MKENSKGIIKKNSDGTYKIVDLNGNDYKVHYKIGETEYTNEFMKNLSWRDIQDIIFMYHIEFVNYTEIEEENKYVPNDVFKFRISLDRNFTNDEITIYTKPLDINIELKLLDNEWLEENKNNIDASIDNEMKSQENFVKEKYFTQQKIDKLKLKFIQKIQECKNPFNIYCVDRDGGYNITEKQLFRLE